VKEYLRRNLLHCKSVGALANTRVALDRAKQVKRMPQWVLAALKSIEVRIEPVTHEMATHRNEVSPYKPSPNATLIHKGEPLS
jgi:hypothetical protein